MIVQFTTDEYPGAMPNGTIVAKCNGEPHDTHLDGALATVIGSIGYGGKVVGYFVEWNDCPEVPVFIAAHRLKLYTINVRIAT